ARGVGAGLLRRFGHGVEHRRAFVHGAALAGGDTADGVGAVFAHLLGVERPRRAGEALNDQLRLLSNQDGHYLLPAAARATTFCAPSAMSLALVTASPDWARIFLPSSTLVPSRRTTRRTFNPTCFPAATT